MKKVKILYAIVFIMFLLVSVPPLSVLVGLDAFCTLSIFSTALGLESKAKINLAICELLFLIIIIILQIILNRMLKKETRKYDEKLEKNLTVIRNYDKLKIEVSYIIPIILAIIFSTLSYFDIFKQSGIGLLLIIFCGIIEVIIAFVVFYNEIQMLNFFKDIQNEQE